MSSSFSEEKSQEFCDAAFDGNLAKVKSLSLDPEVNLNRKDWRGFTPFSKACYHGHVATVRYLLDFHDNQRPIDHNLVNGSGVSPFSIACLNGHEKVVEMLVDDERIDVNRPDNIDKTPLHRASWNGQVGIVKILLASTRQIDTLKKDKEGKTAADIARATIRESWESEEDFQDTRKRCQLTASLLQSYEKDPHVVREQLRRELGIDERRAGELFALVVFLSDGHLEIPVEIQE